MDIQNWQIRFWAARERVQDVLAIKVQNEARRRSETLERDCEHAAMLEYRKNRDRRILGRG